MQLVDSIIRSKEDSSIILCNFVKVNNIDNIAEMRIVWLFVVALGVGLLSACQSEQERMVGVALAQAGDNRAEIEDFLSAYAGDEDDDQAAAARWLAAAMIGHGARNGAGFDSIEALYREGPRGQWSQFDSAQLARGREFERMPLRFDPDLQTLKAEYLKSNFDDTWKMRNLRPWNARLTIEEFCELLLPYRMGDEPLSRWREPYCQWLAELEPQIAGLDNSVDAARLIARQIGSAKYNVQLSTPHRRATDLLAAPYGYCRDDCDRTVFAMRAMGVAVAVDMMIASPDNFAPHQWTVVYDTAEGAYRMFDNMRFLPTRDSVHNDLRRKGKVYRQTFAPELGRLKKYASARHAPQGLLNPRLRDVTAEYFGRNTAAVEIDAPGCDEVYLAIFSPRGFIPIDIASTRGRTAQFSDIEPELVYFPVAWAGRAYEPVGPPFMLASDGSTHTFVADSATERARLTRKFTSMFILRERLATAVGTHIQAAASPSGPWCDLDVITRRPDHNYCRVDLRGREDCRFFRIYHPGAQAPHIGEIIASRDSLALDPVAVRVYAPSLAVHPAYAAIADGDILSWCAPEPGTEDVIISAESAPNYLFFVPHNDDNFVVPGQDYELLYFANGRWHTLLRKVADDFFIECDVPRNAVMLLRNRSKGREENVFVWHDQRQLFSTDLCRELASLRDSITRQLPL